jgi:hypothetical protein
VCALISPSISIGVGDQRALGRSELPASNRAGDDEKRRMMTPKRRIPLPFFRTRPRVEAFQALFRCIRGSVRNNDESVVGDLYPSDSLIGPVASQTVKLVRPTRCCPTPAVPAHQPDRRTARWSERHNHDSR